MTQEKKSELKRIDRVYNDGKTEPIEKGFVMYVTDNGKDALAEFVGIDDLKEVNALLNGVKYSLEEVQKQWNEMKQKEVEKEK